MKKLSRNDPCWCGSGKKYKHCHLNLDRRKIGLFQRLSKKAQKQPRHPTDSRIIIKTDEQIAGIRKSCQLVKKIFEMLENRIVPGITTDQINGWTHRFILDHGAFPAPLHYKNFPKSVCTSINNVICHGIPDDTVLKEGDILNVDVTTVLKGYYGDSSRMYIIGGKTTPEAMRLVKTTKECLNIGIEQAKPNNTIGDIGHVIQHYAEVRGYSIVRDYAGHGVGLRFHEDPPVNHFGEAKSGPIIVPNMVFTIEPMVNIGGYKSRTLDDGWTAVTADGSLSAQWEHTILITESGSEVLTK
ncbi:MAG: type I methionyl aminopeptidase [Candidatus Cloacimonetes bacterium 4572_55]|nr:MAG: type I methionyl aminopeptidase [Candidatus Cloacimonetes bacterium 4572_55]